MSQQKYGLALRYTTHEGRTRWEWMDAPWTDVLKSTDPNCWYLTLLGQRSVELKHPVYGPHEFCIKQV